MEKKDMIYDEIQKVRVELSGYSNVLVQGDNSFRGFLKLFELESDKEKINLILYKRLDHDIFRLLLIYDKKIVICNCRASYNNEFNEKLFRSIIKLSEPLLTTGPITAKTILEKSSYGINDSTIPKELGFEPLIFILSSIQYVSYLKHKSEIALKIKNIKEHVFLNVDLISVKDSDDNLYIIIANLIENISTIQKEKNLIENDVFDQVKRLIKRNSFEIALKIIDQRLEEENSKDDNLTLYYLKALALFKKDDVHEAQNYIELLFNLFYKSYGNLEDSSRWSKNVFSIYSALKALSSEISYNLKNYDKALWEINDAYFSAKESNEWLKYRVSREKVLNGFMEEFSNLEHYQRKVIYLENDLPSYKPDTILPLRIDNVRNLVFPPSHPIKGELYVGHPFKASHYYPLDEYEQLLFDSQFEDLNHLLQCLGATEIIYEHIEGESESNESEMKRAEIDSSQLNQKVEGGNVFVSANLARDVDKFKSVNNEQQHNNKSESSKRNFIIRKYTPKRSPYIPSDLDWYKHNDTWVRIAQQRMQGELTYYEMIMSSKSLEVINENEKNNINSDYKSLISGGFNYGPVKGKASHQDKKQNEVENDITSSLAKEGTKEWKLKVTFAPLDQLADSYELITDTVGIAELGINELKYIEYIKLALDDDGIIDANERRILDLKQKQLNLSIERAEELENIILLDKYIVKNDFSENEHSYIADLISYLKDNLKIGETERRFLNKEIEVLGISEERAREIEEIIQAKLCDSEND